MKYLINQRVKTPIGEGIFQGMYRAMLSNVEKCLVRMPVNEQTAPHLKDESCVTPKATTSALFAFPSSELGGGRRDVVIMVAFVAFVILCLGPHIAAWLGLSWPL